MTWLNEPKIGVLFHSTYSKKKKKKNLSFWMQFLFLTEVSKSLNDNNKFKILTTINNNNKFKILITINNNNKFKILIKWITQNVWKVFPLK